MLDIKLFRENPEIIKKDLEKRKEDHKKKWVDEVVKLDKKWRENMKKSEDYRREKNEITKKIAKTKQRNNLIKKSKEIEKKIRRAEKKNEETRQKIQHYLDRLPNIMHESVPYGESDEDNVPIRFYGKKPEFGFEPKNHIELCEANDWFDIERASKVGGSRQYYLKNDMARLQFALLNYAIDFLRKKGKTFMITPSMAYKEMFYGTGFLPSGNDDIYYIKGKNTALVGTSEVTLVGYHAGETLLLDELPKKYCGYSSCYRTEAGSHGKDTKGVFRIHEFAKIEQVSFEQPEHSWEEHDDLIRTAEEFWQSLGIHYRVVNICTGDLGVVAAKKYDIEAWMPGQKKYREVVSCSNCTDYQARRLGIKFRVDEGKPPAGHVHTLNSTCVAPPRALAVIIENYQTKEGKVRIPKVLQPYMGGQKWMKA